jgi:hypothetical protein
MFDEQKSVATLQNFTLVITFARILSLPQRGIKRFYIVRIALLLLVITQTRL